MAESFPAILIGDAPGLDFLNSIATPADTPVDWIADGEGYLRWLGEAGLVDSQTLAAMCAQARPGELDRIAEQARELREWFRAFVQRHKGRALPRDALAELEPLNRLLARGDNFSRIVADAAGDLKLVPVRRWPRPEALLLPVAEAMAQLVCGEDFSLVKACEGPHCTLLFADRTRGHARRWCSMALCGNRAKQAAHRHRRKTGAA